MSVIETASGTVLATRVSGQENGWRWCCWLKGNEGSPDHRGTAETRSDALVLGGEALGMAVALKNTVAGQLRKAIEDFDADKAYGTIGPVDN